MKGYTVLGKSDLVDRVSYNCILKPLWDKNWFIYISEMSPKVDLDDMISVTLSRLLEIFRTKLNYLLLYI